MTRREVTGRKPGTEPSPMPRLTCSIPEFCLAAGISESMFYKIRKQGLGPREMKVGTRTLIPVEDAVQWKRERIAANAKTSANMATPSAPPALPAPAAVLPPPRKIRARRKSARSAQRDNAPA